MFKLYQRFGLAANGSKSSKGGDGGDSKTERRFAMGKHSNRVPSALKHGIFSGIGALPTENSAKFRKFKKQIFAELGLVGPSEEDIGDKIVCLEWRLKNLFTYELAKRAKQRHRSIYAQFDPPQYEPYLLPLAPPIDPDYREPEPPSPEELAARRKAADEQAKAELGDAIELVELGNVVTYEFLEKQLAIMERLEVMIARAYKKLLYVRGVKSMSFSTAAAASQPRLGNAA
jgi:hypothetical protein